MATRVGTFDWGDQVREDTIDGHDFVYEVDAVALDLTGVTIEMQIRLNGSLKKTLAIGTGITVTDAVNGTFRVNNFRLGFEGVYNYDIQMIYVDGSIKTYLKGTINVLDDTTKL